MNSDIEAMGAIVDSVYPDLTPLSRRETVRHALMFRDAEKFGDAYVWSTNQNAMGADLTSVWVALGFMNQAEADATEALRSDQSARFLREYAERQRNHVPSAEEMFEMRAAFGEGETVVDIITGRRFTT